VSLFSWLATLRKLPLTIAFPVGNAVHILIPLSCWIFLGETIEPRRWLGIGLLLIGLVIVAKPAAKLEARL
jgi:drug/metabolite transporter (DMT)-like permease